MKLNRYPDRTGVAMIAFGVLLGASYFYFRQFWLIVLGIAWIMIPLFLTADSEEEE
ncbi:general stress protein CsbA [Filimonas zeae]|uniref:Uncharacterized protein n=1 Tax=Filimonas zeae TaxID=1737353 RepID=A0A917J1T6_9BACT|nr:hypothetical protein [Filimonas zeae]MDR6341606.1 general stress protein CsbA [Filimonas zeae]GGH75058.1 hypothetical protein GCM10011379_38230 [Filimonas zeae]